MQYLHKMRRSLLPASVSVFALIGFVNGFPAKSNVIDAMYMLNNPQLYKNNYAKLCRDATMFNYNVASKSGAEGFIAVLNGWKFLGEITPQQYAKMFDYMRNNCRDGLVVPRR